MQTMVSFLAVKAADSIISLLYFLTAIAAGMQCFFHRKTVTNILENSSELECLHYKRDRCGVVALRQDKMLKKLCGGLCPSDVSWLRQLFASSLGYWVALREKFKGLLC